MAFAGFVLIHLLLAAFVGASAYALGRRLLGRLAFASAAEAFAVCMGIGLGTIGTALFLLGLVGALDRAVVVVLLLACHLFGWRSWRDAFRNLRRPSTPSVLASLAAAAVLAPLVWAALYPPVQFDATMYHLPTARDFALAHRVTTLPAVRYVVFPQLNEILFAAALLLRDDLTAQLLELLFFAIAGLAILAWGSRFRSASGAPGATGLAALGLWLGSPILALLAVSAYVEVAVAAFAAIAIHAFACWSETREDRWLLAAGLAVGFTAATKYQGLYFAAALGAVLVVRGVRRREVRPALLFAAAVAAAALPWYVRNFVAAGSPVWPFLGGIFGYRYWTDRDFASMVWSLKSFGWPRTPGSFLALPWRLAHPPATGEILGLGFLLLPLTALVALPSRRIRWLAGLVVGYLVFWFLSSQQFRFLVPILPALSLLTANAVAEALTRLPAGLRRPVLAVWLAGVGILALPALARPYAALTAQPPPPITPAQREAFLTARFPSYPLYARLNAERGTHYTIYSFHDEHMKYYASGTHLGDWFGLGRYADVSLASGRALAGSLERLSADFLLVNEEAVHTPLPEDADFQARFTPIYRNGPIRAYRFGRE